MAGLQFPEGPAFSADGTLYCCALLGGAVFRIGPAARAEPVVRSPRPNGLAISPVDGSLWIADSGLCAIMQARPDTDTDVSAETTAEVAVPGPFLGPNDLLFAPDGTLYFTDPGQLPPENPSGRVYRRTPQGDVEQIAGGLAYPNGLALGRDGRSLIVAETHRNRLVRMDLQTGAVSAFSDVGAGPDGMAYGPDGLLYVALYREGCVAVVDAVGRVTERIPVLDAHPTNCAVQGEWLYVTLAETGCIQRLPLGGYASR